jgi:hypothetical protein
MEKKAVITGIGVLGDCGIGKENFHRFFSGPISVINPSEIDFDAYIDTALVRRADHVSRCALMAVTLALKDANFTISKRINHRIGVVLSTMHGALHHTVEYHTSLALNDPKLVSPLLFGESGAIAAVSHISTTFGIRGYTTTTSGYCSAIQALQIGVELIQYGALDACLVGGADVNHDFLTKAYKRCLKNPQLIAKSFGGSGFVLLESLPCALQRKTKIYAQIEGVSVITAAHIKAKRYSISPLNELLYKNRSKPKYDCLLNASFAEKDSLLRRDLFLRAFKGIKFDCSDNFGYGFSAAEAFQIILGALGVSSLEPASFFKASKVLKGHIGRLFIMRTALAGANACALLSHYPLDKD